MTLTKAERARVLALDPDDRLDAIAAILAVRRAKRNAQTKESRARNPEHYREYSRQWRQKNRKRVLAARRAANKERPEIEAARRRRYKEQRRLELAEWKRRNPDKVSAANHRLWQRRKARAYLERDPAAVRRMLEAQLPGYLDAAARQDIVADICAAIAARTVMHKHLSTCARPFVAAYNRMFDHFKTLSLDAPLPGAEGVTYLDRLANREESHAT